MGLDSVQLLLAVEDAFDVQFTDAEASELRAVGDLHLGILTKLATAGRNVEALAVWDQLCAIIVEETGVSLGQLTPEAELVRDLGIN